MEHGTDGGGMTDKSYVQIDTGGAPVKAWIKGVPFEAEAAKQLRNAAGLPGIILHGMATMAFASKAVLDAVAGGDPARLRRIKVRFSKPVFPGETLTTRGWVESKTGGVTTYGFETLNGRGSPVLRNGVAEVLDG